MPEKAHLPVKRKHFISHFKLPLLVDCLKQKWLTTYRQVYHICRNKTSDYNSTKDGGGKQDFRFLHYA